MNWKRAFFRPRGDTFTVVAEAVGKEDGAGLLSSVSGRWCPQEVRCGVGLHLTNVLLEASEI